MFETQCITPESFTIQEIDYTNLVSKAKKVAQHLHSNVRRSRKNIVAEPEGKGKNVVVPIDDDDDDFVSDVPWKLNNKAASMAKDVCSRGSSDEFVTQKHRKLPSGGIVLSNKRATILSRRLRDPVEILRPYEFPYLTKAKELKSLILSPEFLQKYAK